MQPKIISIGQALHGYSRGHKELASSVELDERSRTTMLMMSDLLAVMDLQPEESYLTVYPLKSASRHVIARTWAAGRNYRPGSVWTHSLILDYQALTLITDLVSLLSYFEMPVEDAIRTYGKPLEIDANQRSSFYMKIDDRIPTALRKLYGPNPQQLIRLPHVTTERDEILTLAIWRQMWPGMRRDFSALTNLGDGSVCFESGCTLRFVRGASPIDDEPSPSIGSIPSIEGGLKELEADLPKPGPTPLRSFLSRYAIEGREPRQLAAALATSWSDKALPVDLRLKQLRTLTGGVSLPRFVRDLLTQEFMRIGNSTDLINLVKSARNETVDIDSTVSVKIASAMGLDDLKELMDTTKPSAPNELGSRLYNDFLINLPVDRLACVANGNERLRMVELRPELLHVLHFWPSDDASRAEIVRELPSGALSLSDALKIFGSSIGGQTVFELMNNTVDFEPGTAVPLLMLDDDAVREKMAAWVVSSPDRLRSVADRSNNLDSRAIETLARAQLGLGEMPSDPRSWTMLIENVIGDVSSSVVAFNVIAYLCALTLPGSEALGVASKVFDPLYTSVRSHILSTAAERYLSKNIIPYSNSFLLRRALIQSALAKWPVTSIEAGAFSISKSGLVQDDIVDEILIQNSNSELEAILRSSHLPERARARIRLRLTPPKYKKGRNPWSWLFDK